MKKLLLSLACLFIFSMLVEAQTFPNTPLVLGTRESYTKQDVNKAVAYFSKLVIAGKLQAFTTEMKDNKEVEVALSKEAFEKFSTKDSTRDTVTQINPVTLEEKMIITFKPHNIDRIRYVSDMVFDEQSKKMFATIKEIHFLSAIYSSENIFMGYAMSYYIKL